MGLGAGRDSGQQLTDAQGPQGQVLGRHQGVLVEQGNLGAAKAHVHDGRAFLNDLVKLRRLGGDGLVADKALLRVADDPNLQPGAHADLVQDDLVVLGLPHGAGGVGPVALHLVPVHGFYKIFQNLAHFLHQVVTDLALAVCLFTQGDHVADVIHAPHAVFPRYLIDAQLQLKGAHIDCRK